MRVHVITGVVGVDDGNLPGAAIAQGKPSAEKWVVNMNHVHGLEQLARLGFVA